MNHTHTQSIFLQSLNVFFLFSLFSLYIISGFSNFLQHTFGAKKNKLQQWEMRTDNTDLQKNLKSLHGEQLHKSKLSYDWVDKSLLMI